MERFTEEYRARFAALSTTNVSDAMDALGLALQAGSAKAVNLVLLGRLSKYFHFTDAQWQDAICRSVPAKFLELNQKAFALGAEA